MTRSHLPFSQLAHQFSFYISCKLDLLSAKARYLTFKLSFTASYNLPPLFHLSSSSTSITEQCLTKHHCLYTFNMFTPSQPMFLNHQSASFKPNNSLRATSLLHFLCKPTHPPEGTKTLPTPGQMQEVLSDI